jgi:hypothetical protein
VSEIKEGFDILKCFLFIVIDEYHWFDIINNYEYEMLLERLWNQA